MSKNGFPMANNGFPKGLEYTYWRHQKLLEQQGDSIIAQFTPAPTVRGNSTVAPVGTGVVGIRQTPNSPYLSVSRYDFFIAYATPDRPQARELYRLLKYYSCKVFLDEEDIRPGEIWPLALRKALEASRAIVVLVSRYTDDAYYLREEIVRAIELARDKRRVHTVIPVILDKLPWGMPYGLSTLQALDATTWSGLQRVAAALVRCL